MILLKWCLTLSISTLTDEEAEQLEGDITYSEVIIFLKNMKNNKSPGTDE